jgi:hypothetical protein
MGKEAGELEYSADTVLVFCEGEYQPGKTLVHVALAKRRAGPRGWSPLLFENPT